MSDDNTEDLASNKLRGIRKIAEFIGEDDRRTAYLIERDLILTRRKAAPSSALNRGCGDTTRTCAATPLIPKFRAPPPEKDGREPARRPPNCRGKGTGC